MPRTQLCPGMKVKVRAFATLSDLMGHGEVVLEVPDGSSVGFLLAELVKRYGRALEEALFDADGHLAEYVKIMVNGRDVDFLSGLDTELRDGDEVFIFPPVGGG